jgi:pilus assembly protein CpaB
MRSQTVLIVAMALVFGGSAAFGVYMVVKRSTGAAPAELVAVVVAAVNIPRGGTITAEQIKTRNFPKDLAPQGVLVRLEDAVDRVALQPLADNEPVLDVRLAPKGSGRGLAALVPSGMRAFTIQTPNVAAGVAGFVLPGNKVDVLLTMSDMGGDDQTGGGVTTTLLQNLEILAVDQRIDAPAENKVDGADLRSVTLLVTPDQAAQLDLGQNRGTLHLSLRNHQDDAAARARPATLSDLRFRHETAAPVVPAEPPAPRRMRTLRGSQEGVVLVYPLAAAVVGR